jgi:hypothetical protein
VEPMVSCGGRGLRLFEGCFLVSRISRCILVDSGVGASVEDLKALSD